MRGLPLKRREFRSRCSAARRPKAPTPYLGSYEDPFSGYRLAQERKRKRFLSLREEAESGNLVCAVLAEPRRAGEDGRVGAIGSI
jgi:hypothetical protein